MISSPSWHSCGRTVVSVRMDGEPVLRRYVNSSTAILEMNEDLSGGSRRLVHADVGCRVGDSFHCSLRQLHCPFSYCALPTVVPNFRIGGSDLSDITSCPLGRNTLFPI